MVMIKLLIQIQTVWLKLKIFLGLRQFCKKKMKINKINFCLMKNKMIIQSLSKTSGETNGNFNI